MLVDFIPHLLDAYVLIIRRTAVKICCCDSDTGVYCELCSCQNAGFAERQLDTVVQEIIMLLIGSLLLT
jgi:hypothetical protein